MKARNFLITMLYAAIMIASSVVARQLLDSCRSTIGWEATNWIIWGLFLSVGICLWTKTSVFLLKTKLMMGSILLILVFFASIMERNEERIHLVKYGILGWLLCWSLGSFHFKRIAATLIAMSVSILDETVQHFTPGRIGDPRDVCFDVFGGIVGILLWSIYTTQTEKADLRLPRPINGARNTKI